MWWTSSSGRIELKITKSQAGSIPLMGQADDSVAALSKEPAIRRQLRRITPEALRDELRGYGAWDDAELADHAQNIQRMLWLAALDIRDEPDRREAEKAYLKMGERKERLAPGGIPKWIRCYDSGPDGSVDRYTVVFTGNWAGKHDGDAYRRAFPYLAMSSLPFHPQGFGQHCEMHDRPCDRPGYSHLGKKIKFTDLPADCQKLVWQDYNDYWELK